MFLFFIDTFNFYCFANRILSYIIQNFLWFPTVSEFEQIHFSNSL